MKRHPMTAIAFALMTAIAAGCSSERDVRADYSDSGPAARTQITVGNGFESPAPMANGYDNAAPRNRPADRAPMAGGNDFAAAANGYANADWDPRNTPRPGYGQMPQPSPAYNQPAVDQQPGPQSGQQFGQQPSQQFGQQSGQQPSQQSGQMTQLMQWERRDMGVAPIRELHDGQMHGPTPNQIPGGQVITTVGLKALLEQRVGAQVIDVLGAEAALPDAIPGVFASAPGSFDDRTQEKLGRMLSSVTRNDPRVPLVFYCGGPECWMSYNAALRAIALGYRNVLWYRGGLEAWNHAGLPFARRGSSGNSGYGGIGANGPTGTNPPNPGYDRG